MYIYIYIYIFAYLRYFLAFLDYPRLKFQTPSSQSYRGFYPKFLFTPTKHPVCLKDPVNLKPAQLKGLVLAHRKQKICLESCIGHGLSPGVEKNPSKTTIFTRQPEVLAERSPGQMHMGWGG